MTDSAYIVPAILQIIFAFCIAGTAVWFWRTARCAHATFLALLTLHVGRGAVITLARGGYLSRDVIDIIYNPAFITLNTTFLLIGFVFVLIETSDARRRMKAYQRSLDEGGGDGP